MSEKIIVTGVNGFVGEHVVDTFKEDGFEVEKIIINSKQVYYIKNNS